MKDVRKQAVSIRLGTSEIRKIKQLADRLGARETDVLRFAINATLNRLAGLCDPEVRGARLLPTISEAGPEFLRYFGLDTERLEQIINEGAPAGLRVPHDDVVLLSLGASPGESMAGRSTASSAGGGVRVVAGSRESLGMLRKHLEDQRGHAGAPSFWPAEDESLINELLRARSPAGCDIHLIGDGVRHGLDLRLQL